MHCILAGPQCKMAMLVINNGKAAPSQSRSQHVLADSEEPQQEDDAPAPGGHVQNSLCTSCTRTLLCKA